MRPKPYPPRIPRSPKYYWASIFFDIRHIHPLKKKMVRPLPETRPPFWVYLIIILFVIGVCACIAVPASLAK